MFIVIDGIDGSGKWTQVDIISQRLLSEWKKVKILDYPRYGETSAFMVEKYLNGEYGTNISPKLASLFFAIDRFDSLHNSKEDFSQYDYIIANRYVSSNMIHQASQIKDENEFFTFLSWLHELEFEICGIPQPDKVFFLNAPPEVTQKLILQKQERAYLKHWKKMDILEADINHLQDAWKKAKRMIWFYENWVEIDCVQNWEMLPKEVITENIMTLITSYTHEKNLR